MEYVGLQVSRQTCIDALKTISDRRLDTKVYAIRDCDIADAALSVTRMRWT
jgi:hypothetical protein